jgi:cell wall assembly regulator SMI1
VAEIEDSWARVTAWLAANAPASYARLSAPALPAEAELAACERDLQMALPPELRRLLLISNGAADFDALGEYRPEAAFLPGRYRLLSAAEVAARSRDLVDVAAEHGDDLIGSWWHPQWVLFADHIAADGIAIDQRPGPGQGAIGVFSHETGTEFGRWASLGDYVARVADSIETGQEFLQRRSEYVARVADGYEKRTDVLRYRPYVDEDGGLSWRSTLDTFR